MQELIQPELSLYLKNREFLLQLVENERSFMVELNQKGKLTQGYANKMNRFLGVIIEHFERTDKLLQMIGVANQIYNYDPEYVGRLKREIADLEKENAFLKKGVHPSELKYCRLSDLF